MLKCPACDSDTPEEKNYATCKNEKCLVYNIPVFVLHLGNMEDEGGIPQ